MRNIRLQYIKCKAQMLYTNYELGSVSNGQGFKHQRAFGFL